MLSDGLRALAVLAVVAFVACGEAEAPVSTADPDRPVQAPADPGPSVTPAPPRSCKRVSRRIVGRELGAAQAIARKARCPLRVVSEDGRALPVTDDFSSSRINVRVERGTVVEVTGLF